MSKSFYTENILIVDDELSHLNSLKELILQEDYKVISASSAADAITQIDNEKIDMVLLDMNMPGAGGPSFVSFAGAKGKVKLRRGLFCWRPCLVFSPLYLPLKPLPAEILRGYCCACSWT